MINILDKKKVENYYCNYLTEKKRLNVEIIRSVISKVKLKITT
jgi:hypothetical protein